MSKTIDTILAVGAVAGGAYVIYKLSKGFEGIGSGASQVGESVGGVAEQAGKTVVSILKIPEQAANATSNQMENFFRWWQALNPASDAEQQIDKSIRTAAPQLSAGVPILAPIPAMTAGMMATAGKVAKKAGIPWYLMLNPLAAVTYNNIRQGIQGWNTLRAGAAQKPAPTQISGKLLETSMLWVGGGSKTSSKSKSIKTTTAQPPKKKTIKLTAATLAALSQHKSLRR